MAKFILPSVPFAFSSITGEKGFTCRSRKSASAGNEAGWYLLMDKNGKLNRAFKNLRHEKALSREQVNVAHEPGKAAGKLRCRL